jgi:futalosine hydrolase
VSAGSARVDVLIVAATPRELAGLAERLARPRARRSGGRAWTSGEVDGLRVGLLATGAGKVNTALALGAVLPAARPGLLLDVGVGGAYPGSGLAVGDTAVASEEWYADEGAEDGADWLDLEALGLPVWEGPGGTRCFNWLPADPVAAELLAAAAKPVRSRTGPFATVSTVTGSKRRAEVLEARFHAVCESMEGAAVAHAALAAGVRFAEIRGISNLVGPRDRPNWRLAEAAEACRRAVVRFLPFWAQRTVTPSLSRGEGRPS